MNEVELSGTSGGNTGSYNNNEQFQRMFTPMAGSAGHGDGHHVIPPYRMAPYPLASSGFPVTAPVLPPSSTARHLLPPSVTQQQQQQQQQQPAHWVLGPNSDTPMQQQQLQQQNNAQFQRLKVEDALSYLDKVKAQFGGQPQVYNDFLDIMKEFKSQAIDTPVVISRVSNLFAGQKELIVGFNTFLPPGFKIIEEGGGQTLGLCQPGQQVVPISSLGMHSSNPPFRSSEQPPVRPVPPPVVPPVSQHQSHIGSQLQSPPGQPVEFNHAINYVNKIKMYYNGRPEVYKAFLDILHNYQREQKNIKDCAKGQSSKSTVTEADVYAQVASLFQDNPELLSEFRQFLPDANGNAGLINGLGAAESAFGGGLGQAAAGAISESVGRPADHTVTKSFNPIHRSQSIGSSHAMPPAKKRRLSKDPVLTPVKSEVPLSDREYFDQLKRTMSHDDMYKEMFNCINHYNKGSISAEDLLVMAGPLISKAPELKSRLISLVESDRRPTCEKKDKELQWHLDLSSCKRYEDQTSYRVLPKKKSQSKSDNRTTVCAKDGDVPDVLNEEYAVFADPEAKRESIIWHFGKLSAYDETVLQIEEERYELDMVMQPHLDLMNGLTEVYQAMQKTTPEEQAKFVINDLAAHCNMGEVHIQRVLKKLYNNRWDTLYEGLKKIPSVAIPVALNRLQEKCAEWDDSKKKFNQSWQESLLKQRIRCLEQQGSKFKNADSKQLKPKTLVKEIEDLAKARESLENEPHMTLPFQDPTVFYDAVKLVSLVSKRQTGVTEEEVWRFKWLLQSVLENVFRIPYVKQELDADEVTSSEGRNESGSKTKHSSKSTRQSSAGHDLVVTQPQNSLVSQDDDTVTVFYCSDSWYALLRVFMVLCDRLAFFIKHTEDLVDDERREFSQVWPASIATTLEQHMQEHNHARKSYPTFLWLTQNLLNGALDLGIYEELIRETFGLEAYVAFTIDKLIQSIVRQILQVVASTDCVDLLKLLEKHQKPNCQSDSELAEYLTLAQSIVQEENCYLMKSIKKGSKGRMTISLLPQATSHMPRPVGNVVSKEWQSASPAPSEEKPLASAKSSSSFNTSATLEPNSRISKSPSAWVSVPSPTPKKPVFLSRNVHKSPGQSSEVSRPKIAKEPIDKTASTMDEEEDDDEEDDEEDMEDDEDECDGSSWVDQFDPKNFLIMRLTSLVQAKKTHKSLSLKKFSRFSKWLTNWKSRNVTEKNEDACCDWLDGKLEETCGKTIRHSEGSSSQLPYHSYVKYSVEADDSVNSSGST